MVMVPIFAITGIILAILDHRLLSKNLLYKKVGSLRTKILTELLSDIESIKANSWEDFFIKKLGRIRKKEIQALNDMSLDRAISNSLFFLTPLICSSLIIFLKRVINNEKLDVVVALAIVSVLNMLKEPLKTISSSVDLYLDFEIGHKSLRNFLNLVKQQPKKEITFPYLKVGEIKLFNCSASIEDDLKTLEILDMIFHRKNKKKKRKVSIPTTTPSVKRIDVGKKDKKDEKMDPVRNLRTRQRNEKKRNTIIAKYQKKKFTSIENGSLENKLEFPKVPQVPNNN